MLTNMSFDPLIDFRYLSSIIKQLKMNEKQLIEMMNGTKVGKWKPVMS